jgi:hypothetical protein
MLKFNRGRKKRFHLNTLFFLVLKKQTFGIRFKKRSYTKLIMNETMSN